MGRRIIIIEDDGNTNLGVSPYQGLFDNLNSKFNGYFDPCANCNNNPNASGMCCCSLPDMNNIRYNVSNEPMKVTYEYHTTCTFNDFDKCF